MKTGKTITELAAEIERQHNTKKDFIAQTPHIAILADDSDIKLQLGRAQFGINDTAHAQIGEHTGIPKAYYDKCRQEAPRLLATNIEAWFKKYPAARMVRTLEGNTRAFLSDRYRPLENYDLAEAVLPVLLENKLDILSCEITGKRLYIKAVHPSLKRDVPTGRRLGDGSHYFFDTVSPAIIISNSEVGLGRLAVDAGVYTRACTNLAMIAKGGMKRTHVSTRIALVDSVIENIDRLLSSETKKATDKAIFLQVSDVVRGAFDEAVFKARCETLGGMAKDHITGDPVKAIELSIKKFKLTEIIGAAIKRHFIAGGDLTRYGIYSAVTRAAQDAESYDDATDLEATGGAVIALPPFEWHELATAA